METQIRDNEIITKRKKKKKKRFGKFLLKLISFIIIALLAFVITIKLTAPDFDFSSLIPKKAYSFVDEKLLGRTTTTETPSSTAPSQTKKSTLPLGYYLPQKEFKNDSSKKGNLVGNILNGGMAWHDDSYIYHLINGEGIYRLYPGTEGYTRLYSTKSKLGSLNISSSNLYFVDESKNVLYKLKKGGSSPEKLAENIKLAYLYGKTIYIITTNNEIAKMNTEKEKLNIIRKIESGTVNFIGLSKDMMYFEIIGESKTSYVCLDKKGKKHAVDFRYEENNGELVKPVLEDGFLYYYKKSGSSEYALCRQKFGSDKVVTLVKNANSSSYAVTDLNRLYYSALEEGQYKMKELNMNKDRTKTLLSVSGVSSSNTLNFYHGGSYDFIIGSKSDGGEKVYASSCVLTGSTNIMHFKNGNWKY